MGVARDQVRAAQLEQLLRRPLRRRATASVNRRGCQLHERAGLHERGQRARIGLHLGVSLRVREHGRDPADLEAEQPLAQVERPAAVRELDEQITLAAPEPEPAEIVGREEFELLEGDLAAAPHLEWHSGVREGDPRLGELRLHRRRRRRVVIPDMRRPRGSGLGRATLIAARFPFKRVMGEELSAEMSERAQQNLERMRDRLTCADVELLTGDATELEIPDDLTVAYFYCPFLGDPFYRVVERLLESVDRVPRHLRLVYNFPAEHGHLIDTGRFRVLDAIRGTWPPQPRAKEKVSVTYLALLQDEREATRLVAENRRGCGGGVPWRGHYDPGFLLRKPDRIGGVVVRPSSSGEGRRP